MHRMQVDIPLSEDAQVQMPEINPNSRIPPALQAVFLASNRGKEDVKPPAGKVAHKVYHAKVFKTWMANQSADKRSRDDKAAGHRRKTVSRDEPAISLREMMVRASNTPSHILSMNALNSAIPQISPQDYLSTLVRSRGYPIKRYPALKSGYYKKPSPLQITSYHPHLIRVSKSPDVEAFRSLIECGLSPNACNSYGESIVHSISRRGDAAKLRVLLENCCSLQVADDYGRTPLHDACWAPIPTLETVELILERDLNLLFLEDARGTLPFGYVRQEHWKTWIEFFEAKKDKFWPFRPDQVNKMASHSLMESSNEDAGQLPDPEDALPIHIAEMVASGKMTPAEAWMLCDDVSVDSDDEDLEDDSEELADDSSIYSSDLDSELEDLPALNV